MVPAAPHPFPTVDVPDHAHYTIGSVILAIGITGIVGNFLVIYAFCRSDTDRFKGCRESTVERGNVFTNAINGSHVFTVVPCLHCRLAARRS